MPKQRPAKIRAALLDERMVYQGMVEIEPDEVTERHLPQITECDLKPGTMRWAPDETNPFGGAFQPLPREHRKKAANVTMEQALVFALLAMTEELPDVTAQWLDGVIKSVDMQPYRAAPLVKAYIEKRNISFKDKE